MELAHGFPLKEEEVKRILCLLMMMPIYMTKVKWTTYKITCRKLMTTS